MTMALRISRWFHRQETPAEPTSPSLVTEPWFIGMNDSDCVVGGRRTDRGRMPIPPPGRRPLTPIGDDEWGSSVPRHFQRHCAFFTALPLEIRREIYVHLFGGRRIHLEFEFHHHIVHRRLRERLGHVGRSGPKRKWRWWHWICTDEPLFTTCDRCRNTEHYDPDKWTGKVRHPWKPYKLMDATNWLRCCRLG